jgi:hypothetical protein
MNWAWDRYDWLNDWQRVGLGLAVVLLLTSSTMYCLGAASLLALSRHPAMASAEADPTATPAVVLQPIGPVATEVNPISPLLADRTPTLRPSSTPVVHGEEPPTRTPSPRPTGTATSRAAGVSRSPLATATRPLPPTATATRTAAPTATSRPSTPTPPVPRGLVPGAGIELPWGDVPSPSPVRGSTAPTPTRPLAR